MDDRRAIIDTVGLLFGLLAFLIPEPASAQHGRTDVEFKVFQFPADHMPRIDGDAGDWSIVPAHYAVGGHQLVNDEDDEPMDPSSLDVTVRVGWMEGMNRLYFLYEAYDDYWDFAPSL